MKTVSETYLSPDCLVLDCMPQNALCLSGNCPDVDPFDPWEEV